VAIDAGRGLLYVADTYNHRIQVFHLVMRDGGAVDVRFAKAIGRHGQAPGELDRPGALARAADGALFAVDSGNRRIQVFAPDLTFVRTWGGAGSGDGQFLRPVDLAVGAAAGLVYVLDADQRRVQAFAYDGTFRFAWGGPRSAEQPAAAAGFIAPFGLAALLCSVRHRCRPRGRHLRDRLRHAHRAAVGRAGAVAPPLGALRHRRRHAQSAASDRRR
jgi:hypothetical protein